MRITLEQFQQMVKAKRATPRKNQQVYSKEQKLFAVEHAKRESQRGLSIKRISKILGVGNSTLWYWMREFEKEIKEVESTKMVSVKPAKKIRQIEVRRNFPSPSQLSITTPSGYKVEGLDVDSAASLLKVLG